MRDPSEFDSSRMLIVGGRSHAVQILRQIFEMLGIARAQTVTQMEAAIELLRADNFTAVFCDEQIGEAHADAFVQAARRTAGLVNPMIPIFLVCSGLKKRDVEAARDLGFTDVLTRPLSAVTVRRKLRVALRRPRPFILAGDFFGPDRRAYARTWSGKERRKRQPRKVKVAAPSDRGPAPE